MIVLAFAQILTCVCVRLLTFEPLKQLAFLGPLSFFPCIERLDCVGP